MGLFTNYKKLNENNKQAILKLIDKILNLPTSNGFLNELNAMKNSLISQAPSDSKALKEIDEQVIASLMKANELLNNGSLSQASTYILNAKSKVLARVSTVSVKGFKPGKAPELDEEQLMDILLNEAQDKIKNAASEYNTLKARAEAGDLAAKSKLTFAFQKYQIAQQNFTAISNDQNRTNIAGLAKKLTEDQKRRIAERKFSDEEFAVIMNQYAEVSQTIAQEGNDVLSITNTIGAVTGAINQNQQDITEAMNMGVQMPTFGTEGLPNAINMPGVDNVVAPTFGAATQSFNPFASQNESDLAKYSQNQLNGSVNLIQRQLEDKEDKLNELKAERAVLDKKITKLLTDYQTLPPAQAKVLEPEIRAAKSKISSSDFQLNNLNQEILQLNNNLALIQKMQSLKERDTTSKAIDQSMGGTLDVKDMSMDIAKQVNKNNDSIKLTEDVNVVTNADNIEFGSAPLDVNSYEAPTKSNEFDDLMKQYGVNADKK